MLVWLKPYQMHWVLDMTNCSKLTDEVLLAELSRILKVGVDDNRLVILLDYFRVASLVQKNHDILRYEEQQRGLDRNSINSTLSSLQASLDEVENLLKKLQGAPLWDINKLSEENCLGVKYFLPLPRIQQEKRYENLLDVDEVTGETIEASPPEDKFLPAIESLKRGVSRYIDSYPAPSPGPSKNYEYFFGISTILNGILESFPKYHPGDKLVSREQVSTKIVDLWLLQFQDRLTHDGESKDPSRLINNVLKFTYQEFE